MVFRYHPLLGPLYRIRKIEESERMSERKTAIKSEEYHAGFNDGYTYAYEVITSELALVIAEAVRKSFNKWMKDKLKERE